MTDSEFSSSFSTIFFLDDYFPSEEESFEMEDDSTIGDEYFMESILHDDSRTLTYEEDYNFFNLQGIEEMSPLSEIFI